MDASDAHGHNEIIASLVRQKKKTKFFQLLYSGCVAMLHIAERSSAWPHAVDCTKINCIRRPILHAKHYKCMRCPKALSHHMKVSQEQESGRLNNFSPQM